MHFTGGSRGIHDGVALYEQHNISDCSLFEDVRYRQCCFVSAEHKTVLCGNLSIHTIENKARETENISNTGHSAGR